MPRADPDVRCAESTRPFGTKVQLQAIGRYAGTVITPITVDDRSKTHRLSKDKVGSYAPGNVQDCEEYKQQLLYVH
jgi:hypothetical protein